jgi:hypothetical protein
VRLKKLFELGNPSEDKAIGAIWLILIFLGPVVLFVSKVSREIKSVEAVQRNQPDDSDRD